MSKGAFQRYSDLLKSFDLNKYKYNEENKKNSKSSSDSSSKNPSEKSEKISPELKAKRDSDSFIFQESLPSSQKVPTPQAILQPARKRRLNNKFQEIWRKENDSKSSNLSENNKLESYYTTSFRAENSFTNLTKKINLIDAEISRLQLEKLKLKEEIIKKKSENYCEKCELRRENGFDVVMDGEDCGHLDRSFGSEIGEGGDWGYRYEREVVEDENLYQMSISDVIYEEEKDELK
ncbi:unnamed protein product [Moneuplotes crassus]|uniref:Uncharacterized protein n=1 Tax=Euplotes crassus TaxID=5936 RepID=A0AAD2D2U5_EUPCR|nr:unnamed protein product [Moneuplotes crassus]